MPVKQLPKRLRQPTNETNKFTPYSMDDLTIGSWMELGRRLGAGDDKKLRRKFKSFMKVKKPKKTKKKDREEIGGVGGGVC